MKSHKNMVLLETNVDDCTPEVISHLMERVMDEGALDIHIIHTIMKKGRLGYLIRVLTKEPEKFSRILMEETGTLGVRVISIDRFEAKRNSEETKVRIRGKIEKIRVKRSEHGIKPEFDDVRRIAKKYGMPFRDVLREIETQI
ncbi:MAG TPA: DUF111 family protein [Candidatus Altiarchaeales archaeon]|nr:DUF111 family protein [Candidatus Altiarchaeales archaeon]